MKFKIDVDYVIDDNPHILIKYDHRFIIGTGSIVDSYFNLSINDDYIDQFKTWLQAGYGFSHGGYFDFAGHFVVDEVSVTPWPRFKSEVIDNEL